MWIWRTGRRTRGINAERRGRVRNMGESRAMNTCNGHHCISHLNRLYRCTAGSLRSRTNTEGSLLTPIDKDLDEG
ncbi:hypothetical protein PspLS_10944 [Pyricularia sp. CBS 133598]|nr:hypothetical protein PspLS_10944 [Pyricularia sp. CBS 133598]